MFLCYVLGAAGSGKTSLLRSFVNKGFKGADGPDGRDAAYEPTSKVVSVVNSVEMGGGEKYLVVSDNCPFGKDFYFSQSFFSAAARIWLQVRVRNPAE